MINYDPDWFVKKILKFHDEAFINETKAQTKNFFFFSTKVINKNQMAIEFEQALVKHRKEID
jgi:hypothetical protein